MADLMTESQQLKDWLVSQRRGLHRQPELSLCEKHTAAHCASELEKLGLNVRRNLWGEGFIADLDAPNGRGRIAIRADMDALPIQELNDVDYKSQVPGVAHMCGHDTHMTVAMGAAKLMLANKSKLTRSVRFLFQPSEETPPGGAKGMIEKGALDGVDEVFGLHNHPRLEVGKISTRVGAFSAAADTIRITLMGRGGHASMPHETLDPIPAAAAIVLELQTLVSRRIKPGVPAVVSVTQITGGTTHNVIPDSVFIQGTVRTFDDATRKTLEAGIGQIAAAVAQGHGLKVKYEFERGYDSIVNHAASVEKLHKAACAVVGEANVDLNQTPMTGGEDFAYYLQHRPGVFFFLGSGNAAKGISEPWHSARFNVDEQCLVVGSAVMAQLALA